MHLGHDHSHEHEHEHKHEHSHGVSSTDLALLKYMLEHNKQHASELSDIGARISDSGVKGAAKFIDEAVHYFDHANESLEKAVGLIEGGE